MRFLGFSLVIAAAAVSLTGCGQMGISSSTARGGIAVVDLDKVAAETGRDRQLAQSLELAQNSLNQRLNKTVENVKEQLSAKKKSYGDELSEEQKKEFSAMENLAVNKLSQIQNVARNEYEQYKQKQIADFRAELRPIAHEIASKKGLSIVIPKNDGLLLSVDSGVDITEEVVKILRERRPLVAQQPVMPQQPAATQQPAVSEPAVEPASTTTTSSSNSRPGGQTTKPTAKRSTADRGDQERR